MKRQSLCAARAATLLLGLLLFASSASAAPVHAPLPGLSGFDKACGVAADSVGNVYVSSAGESQIEIFDPSYTPLETIPNSNQPCGLAVNSKGELFVSERSTGKVVRYKPDSYPLSSSPTYGLREEIDASGVARGIAIDPKDDRLYVAKADRVAVYKQDGSFETDVVVGALTDATGVGAYTTTSGDRYLFVAENATDTVKIFVGTSLATLALRETVDGSDDDAFKADKTPDDGFGFGTAGAYLAVDEANGHFFVYDAEHDVVDEFEATGTYLTQVDHPEFTDAEPTAIAIFPQRSEVQKLFVKATAGTYTLSFESETTAPIPYNASETQVEAALEALGAIGPEDVSVAGRYRGAFASGTYMIAFREELGGRNVPQLGCDPSGLTAGAKTCTPTTEVQGSGPGRLYVSAGAGPGAKVLAFGVLAAPSRPPRPDLSFDLAKACGVAVDSHGNRYVAADATIYVYPPDSNTVLTTISDPDRPCDLAVDSEGHVYALNQRNPASPGDQKAVYYTPAVYPPVAGTSYSGPTTVATPASFPPIGAPSLGSVALNPSDDRVFVSQRDQTIELEAAREGSDITNPCFACGLGVSRDDLAVYGATGNVYLADGTSAVSIVDATGTKVLGRINGVGSPKGPFSVLGGSASVAVDQANGHALIFIQDRGVAEEYEASGAFVAEFGVFDKGLVRPSGIAVDNSGGPSNGNLYVAFFQETKTDLTAFGPLSYGEPPITVTGLATNVGGTSARLNGSVDPRGFVVTQCYFEHLPESTYNQNIADEDPAFQGATSVPCAQSAASIGKGIGPVDVHADVSGLNLDVRHRFRLVAENEYGIDEGDAGILGPPILTAKAARPIAYTEATLNATIDPSGLPTTYEIHYGTSPSFGEVVEGTIAAGAGPTEIAVPIFGLQEGAAYHFRVIARNDAKTVEGPNQSFETLQRPVAQDCPNEEFRTGRSAALPDCRAYELVSPPDTRGATPYAADHSSTHQFNNWLISPRGDGAGERVSFFLNGTLPGYEGNGRRDGYRAERGEGPHPSGGWQSELFSPSYAQTGGESPVQQGIGADQLHAFWQLFPGQSFAGTLDPGTYVSTPSGKFEPLGVGSLKPAHEPDPNAVSRFLTEGAEHVIFESEVPLEPGAAPAGTTALYDRDLGGATRLVSSRPDGSPFAAGEDAIYVGATEEGSAIVFEVAGALYLRRAGATTVKVADAPNTFAGLSADGSRVFYTNAANGANPGELFAFDAGTQTATEIAEDSVFVNVSADGSRVYFTSEEVLDDEAKGTFEADNLYLWDETGTTFIALLDPQDLVAFDIDATISLRHWTSAIAALAGPSIGRASSPTRSTAAGEVLVFQSHADLTSFPSGGKAQVYRYEAASGQILCLSCDPSGTPPASDARLQSNSSDATTASAATIIPNLTADGQAAFFQSTEQLVPEDANTVQDVYEWRAQGASGCKRPAGCLALISSGQGEDPSYLYSMTPDGHDVFFTTTEKLVGADITGSPSIYDARVGGGIPNPPAPAPCEGDACQGPGAQVAPLPAPTSTGQGEGDLPPQAKPKRCPKGKRRVTSRRGKVRCVKKRQRGKAAKRAQQHRRAAR